jgi:hypothetical protein
MIRPSSLAYSQTALADLLDRHEVLSAGLASPSASDTAVSVNPGVLDTQLLARSTPWAAHVEPPYLVLKDVAKSYI